MKERKTTMRDIAKECGISVATVSYVLNHSEKEKISNDMRFKVFVAATRLGYEAHKVRANAKKKNGLIGVIVNLKENNTKGKELCYYDLAAELSSEMRLNGFETVLIVTKNLSDDIGVIKSQSLDAVIMIDIDNSTLKDITTDYYVPILFLNCTVSDPIFCEIKPNYNLLFSRAKSILNTDNLFLLTEDFRCQKQVEEFSQYFLTKNIFINTPDANLSDFLKLHIGQKGIVLGDFLGIQAQKLFPNENLVILSSLGDPNFFQPGSQILSISNKAKAAVAVRVLKDMLVLDYQGGESNCILLESEQL